MGFFRSFHLMDDIRLHNLHITATTEKYGEQQPKKHPKRCGCMLEIRTGEKHCASYSFHLQTKLAISVCFP